MSKLSSNEMNGTNSKRVAEKISTLMTKFPEVKESPSTIWVNDLQKESVHNDNYIITNLVAELAIALNDKVRLEGENSLLQIENEEYQKKYLDLETDFTNERNKLTSKIKQLEESVNRYEFEMKEKDISNLEETKKYLSEINSLKANYYSLKETCDKNTFDFKNLITQLEKELETTQFNKAELSHELKLSTARNQKYKEKLKFSTEVINKLNKMATTFMNRKISNKKCQTEEIINPSKSNFEHEALISELFFKPDPMETLMDTVFFENSNVLD